MTSTALDQLYPINQIGADGFQWWLGQIEMGGRGVGKNAEGNDPKGSARYKVRIVGLHPKSCDAVVNEDLPWAITMMPVTSPHVPGACMSVSDQLEPGVWVVGFFLDNDKQQPCIIGSIGAVANSSDKCLESEDPSTTCNSFTTFLSGDKIQKGDQGSKNTICRDQQKSGYVFDGVEREGSVISSKTNMEVAQEGDNSASNPAGTKICAGKADPCGEDTNLSQTFTRLFGEMLHEIQRNDGKLGTYLVNEATGGLYDSIDVGRGYVNKAILLVRTFVARIKGFVLAKIKEATKYIVDAILRPDDKGNALTTVTKSINETLAKVGCKMADLSSRLAKWLEDIIFGYLFNIYKATACQLDKFIQGLLNKIQSLMNDLLNDILGPLQSILGAIAAPLNMIGDAINYVLKLLGIQCSGPPNKCAKTTKVCSDNKTNKRKDFLDDLLDDLSKWPNGPDWNQYTCEDAYEGTKLDETDVVFVGGIQNPIGDPTIKYNINDIEVKEGNQAVFTVTRSGATYVESSLTYRTKDGTATKGEDYEETSGVLGFTKDEVVKTITVETYSDSEKNENEDFFIRLFVDTPIGGEFKNVFDKNVAKCRIVESRASDGTPGGDVDDNGDPIDSNPSFPVYNPGDDSIFEGVTEPEEEDDDTLNPLPTYQVVADKNSVKEGEFITFTIITTNIDRGTTLRYRLFGTGITPSDITSSQLTGTFVVQQFTDNIVGNYSAKVVIGIAKDTTIEDEESLIFSIPGTGAQDTVLIISDTADLDPEQIAEIEDLSSDTPLIGDPKLPRADNPITDRDGGIIEVNINNSGDPYDEPPEVFITGEGYGARGIVLLDDDGYVREIRIVDPGYGYRLNLPDDAEKECIIDSFTMIKPGTQYTSTPIVYVDGKTDVAEAVINSDGQVISVRIKDRTLVFDSYPDVRILGGGGYGAQFIPSFVCLDPSDRVKIGSAKVGTGSYIDCP